MILLWQCENYNKYSLIFGYVKFVKGSCTSNYASCPPDPSCYLFIAPSTKCKELISGYSNYYFTSKSYYLDATCEWSYYVGNYNYIGYNDLVCKIYS